MSVWSYQGKRVLVVGCYSGIGRATAEELIKLGAEVEAMDIRQPDLPVAGYTECDLRDTKQIDRAIAGLNGKFDALFYCSGLPQTFPALDVLRVNFAGMRHFIDSALPLLNAGAAVAIVASTAGNGWVMRAPFVTEFVTTANADAAIAWAETKLDEIGDPYSFSKEAAILWMMRNCARFIRQGVRLNCLSPGPTITGMTPDFDSFAGPAIIDVYTQPLGRRSSPEEQAYPLIFLNSDAASYINGCNFITDAGFTSSLSTGQIDLDQLLKEASAA